MENFQCIGFGVLLNTLLAVVSGCASSLTSEALLQPDARLVLEHHIGGRCERTMTIDGRWYIARNGDLLHVDPDMGDVLAQTRLSDPNDPAPITDLAIAGQTLYALIEDQSVVALAWSESDTLRVTNRLTFDAHNVLPRELSVVSDDIYVSGAGGIVRLKDNWHVATPGAEAGSVVMTESGLAACFGRRVKTIPDLKYIGAASHLEPLPEHMFGSGMFLFELVGLTQSTVGIMGANIRQTESRDLDQPPNRYTAIEDSTWLLMNDSIDIESHGRRRVSSAMYECHGARDVARIDADRVGVVGSFGYGVFDTSEVRRPVEPGENSMRILRSFPGEITSAHSDGRAVTVTGPGGSWIYRPGGFIEQTTQFASPKGLQDRARVVGASARIDPAGEEIVINNTRAGEQRISSLAWGRVHCIVPTRGHVLVGHDNGVAMLRLSGTDAPTIEHEVALIGPIRFLFPMLDDCTVIAITATAGIYEFRYSH